MNNKRIFSYKHYKQLHKIKSELVYLKDIENYFLKCSKVVFNALKSKFSQILYFDLFSYNFENNKISILHDHAEYNFNIKIEILQNYKWGQDIINNKKAASLTKTIIEKNIECLILTNNFEFTEIPGINGNEDNDIKIINLNTLDTEKLENFSNLSIVEKDKVFEDIVLKDNYYNADIKEYIKEYFDLRDDNVDQILRNLLLHKLYYSDIQLHYYIYIIKPRISHMQFNGAIALTTYEALSVDDIIDLSSVSLEILCETSVPRIEKIAKDAEYKTLIGEMSHSMRHEYGALQKRLNEAEGSITLNNNEKAIEEIGKSKAITRRLASINKFMIALQKAALIEEEIDPDILEALTPVRDLSLQQVFLDIIDTLVDSLDIVRINTVNHQHLVKTECLPFLRNDIRQKFANFYLSSCKEGAFVVILDLMKNALKFTNSQKPRINIYLQEQENYYRLHFVNNMKISQAGYDYLKNNIETTEWTKSGKVGWRVIRKILEYEKFGFSGKKWCYDIDVRSLSEELNETDIFLVIPKEDIYEKN